MSSVNIVLPEKFIELFGPERGAVLYRAVHGGRGSGKSFNLAKMAAVWGTVWPLRTLCVREYQNSIKESFHAELKAAIESEPFLAAQYNIGVDFLRGHIGSEFFFRGLQKWQAIKSLAKIDLTIVEEAETVSENAWLALEATVFRQPRSEMWVIWNPLLDGSPVDLRFRKAPPKKAVIREVNWDDNPFFPENLEELRRREQERLDPNTYDHVWNGAYLTNSAAQVLSGKWQILDFSPKDHWDGPYQGGDFGFSQDPLAAVRCWIDGPDLYISHEAFKTQLELDDTARFISTCIPDFPKYLTRWDNARPESISHIKKHGLPRSISCEKWKGSVEDGIAFLRAFRKIYIHSRCTNLIKEAKLYSYKIDRLSGDVLPDILDAHNHGWDAVRYALGPMIKKGYSYQLLEAV